MEQHSAEAQITKKNKQNGDKNKSNKVSA